MRETTSYSEKQIELASMAKALAHPARIAIIDYLINKQSCVCGELVAELPLAQATVSQHLKELKNVGLIKGEIEGTKVCYCIDTTKWKYVEGFFSEFINQATMCASNSCC